MFKKNIRITAIIFLAGILNLYSCKKASINFGQEFLGEGLTDVVKVDTLSANISTVYMDSFVTNNRGVIMLGAYTDPIFGRVTTQSYFEFAPPAWTQTTQPIFYDSIVLILKPNGTYYGDSTKPIKIIINELKDSLVFDENKFNFYNQKTFAVKTPEITSSQVKIAPLAKQTISIRLPDSLGVDLLRRLRDVNDRSTKSVAEFLNYFKGIRISTDGNSEMIANCSDDAVMRIYYRQDAGTSQSKTIDFTVASKSRLFNNISIDRAGTVLGTPPNNINSTNRQIPSEQTNNAAYLQSTTNTAIKITFPSLREITKLPNFARILKAALVIKPVKGTYNTIYPLPSYLRLSETDVNNKPGNDLYSVSSSGSYVVQTGLLQTDYALGDKTQYTFDLTQYIKTVISTPDITRGEGLLLSPPSPNYETNFNRAVIGNNKNSIGNIKLDIYYAAIK